MLKDKIFPAEVEKTKAEFDPLSGVALQREVRDAANIPPDALERSQAARGNQ